MDGNDNVVAGLGKREREMDMQMEETDLEIARDHLRIPRSVVSDISDILDLAIEYAKKEPVRVYRYGGDNKKYRNDFVLDLFTELRDEKVEEGEPLKRGELCIQDSLDQQFLRKRFKPNKGYEGLGEVEMSLPDIFLIESYGEDLPEILDFFFHLICFYGEDMPAIYLLTEKGYRPVHGFGFNPEKRVISLNVSNGSKKNPVSYSDRYEVSRLGINKV